MMHVLPLCAGEAHDAAANSALHSPCAGLAGM
jgi:hypothetical protein